MTHLFLRLAVLLRIRPSAPAETTPDAPPPRRIVTISNGRESWQAICGINCFCTIGECPHAGDYQ
jgi:hypothetical protein